MEKKGSGKDLQAFFYQSTLTYILIAHVPIRSLTVRHHFPHDNTVTPYITGWRELSVCNGLRSRPANGDLPSLWICEWVGEHEILGEDGRNTQSHTYKRKREGEKIPQSRGSVNAQHRVHAVKHYRHTKLVATVTPKWTHRHPDSPGCSCRSDLRGHPQENGIVQSQKLYTPDYCWRGCCVPPSLCAHSSCPTDISCLLRCRAACPPAGSL